ncbi:MAG: phosphatidylserine decarboxylase [Elusimicrobiota bacterium]|jgi:phosphatidylserine decarboxylase
MIIATEGIPFILGGFGAAAVGYLLPWKNAGIAVTVLGVLLSAFCTFFFRDPERPLPQDPARIYSPGDGRVLSVGAEDGKTTVRIFLSIFNVHIQRAPCAGTVSEVRYTPGTFRAAMKAEAAANERNRVTIAVEGRKESVETEQIAGLIARRIRCWVRPGDKVAAGERYGLIQFGSQAALHLPPSVRPLVKPGDVVRAGITPIAQW